MRSINRLLKNRLQNSMNRRALKSQIGLQLTKRGFCSWTSRSMLWVFRKTKRSKLYMDCNLNKISMRRLSAMYTRRSKTSWRFRSKIVKFRKHSSKWRRINTMLVRKSRSRSKNALAICKRAMRKRRRGSINSLAVKAKMQMRDALRKTWTYLKLRQERLKSLVWRSMRPFVHAKTPRHWFRDWVLMTPIFSMNYRIVSIQTLN